MTQVFFFFFWVEDAASSLPSVWTVYEPPAGIVTSVQE